MMSTNLPRLPLGEASFSRLRQNGHLYVDKTALLQKLIEEGRAFFLARPRRFGKSLTISTLYEMLTGNDKLFCGLDAEPWVKAQSSKPWPVLWLDFSSFDSNGSAQDLTNWVNRKLLAFAEHYAISTAAEASCAETLDTILELVSKQKGAVAVLIDEYDAPLLDNLNDLEKLQSFRKLLRQFYKVLKACSPCICFSLITGISLFVKNGIFSAANNLIDISSEVEYGAITGYTQKELEDYFHAYIDDAVRKNIMPTTASLLEKLKKYYNGFSFDGQTKVYNPFSLLSFFRKYQFSNYWYSSGSVTFIENYFKNHKIASPDSYHLLKVDEESLAPREIEAANPESFLYQAGYLTLVQRTEKYLILDYPNQEVLNSLSKMYLSSIYPIPDYVEVGQRLWQAVEHADFAALAKIFNAALASLPYHDFGFWQKGENREPNESFYRALFLMLLRGCGVQAHGEMPTCRGRSDVLIESPKQVLLMEFKLAKSAQDIAAKRKEGEKQILDSGYLEPYLSGSIPVSSTVFVVDARKRQIVFTTTHGGSLDSDTRSQG